MKQSFTPNFSDRMTTAADAKKAMLAKFQPKPTVTAAEPVDRKAIREAELEGVREARLQERETARVARAQTEAAQRRAALEAEQTAMDAVRGQRKERKQNEKANARARRAERYGALLSDRSSQSQ